MSYLALAKKVQARLELAEAEPAEPSVMDGIIEEAVIAVLIDSAIIGAPLWVAFDDTFDPGDDTPVFYGDELEVLKNKPAETLRKIYESKRAFGPRTRVRQ